MELPRREILKATGTSVAAGTVLGSLSSTGAASRADPADEFDAAHYSNYRSANRGVAEVNWIVLHTTAGRYSGAVSWFKDPRADVSAHYVISNDGYAKKMVRLDDVAYHASGFNANSIGIEHEWYGGMGPVTDATYRKSAEVVDYLAERFDITKRLVGPEGPCRYDSGFIIHREAPTDAYCSRSNATDCPQGFDVDTYMSIVGGDDGGGGGTAPDPTFEEGDRVATTTDLNVRSGPGASYDRKATLPEGSAGYVRGGPRENDGYRWWKVGFNAGYEGWSVQRYLTAAPTDGGDGRLTDENVEELASILTSEAGRYLAEDVERRAVGYTVVNRMDERGTDRVKDVSDAYATGEPGSDASKELARDVLTGDAADPTEGATFFYSPRSMPAEGEDTGGSDTSGGLEWVPGLARRHYRPGWGRDNERVYIEGVRPRFYKFFTASDARSKPECSSDVCVGDAVTAADGGATAFDKPRSFSSTASTVPEGTAGTVVGDGIYGDGTGYAKVHWSDGTTGYTPAGTLGGGEDDPAFSEGDRVKVTADSGLVVHDDAGLSAPDVWTAPEGAAGYIRDGPAYTSDDDYVWWKVGFNAGHEGWCVQEYLTEAPLDGGDDEGDDGGDGGGGSGRRTESGRLSTDETAFYTHDPGSGTDEMTIRLSGDSDLDVDLYVTLDGRRPDRKDYDRRSWNFGPDEELDLAGNELEDQLGVLVDAYSGSGKYTLEFVPGSSDAPGDDPEDPGDDPDDPEDPGDDPDDPEDPGDGGDDDDDFWDIIDDIFEEMF